MKYRYIICLLCAILSFNIHGNAQLASKTPPQSYQLKIDGYNQQIDQYIAENNLLKLGDSYTKIAFVYWEFGSTKDAVHYFNKAVDINNELGNKNGVKKIFANVGLIYSDVEMYDEALRFLNKSLDINKSQHKKKDICGDLINIASVEQYKGDHKASVKHAEEALSIATELNDINLMRNCYSLLAEGHENLGNSEESLKYYETYATLQKHLQKEEIKKLENRTVQAEAEKTKTEKELKTTVGTLMEVSEEAEQKQGQINLLSKEKELADLKIKEHETRMHEAKMRQRIIIISGLSIIFITIVFTLILYRQFHQKKHANRLLERKNKEIEKQKIEIEEQRDFATTQKQKLTDSIQYAKRIQKAVLPPRSQFSNVLNEYFIYFKPRDIVSGDFYWMTEKENILIVAAADCTGHGVPGAFMSMLGVAFLNEIVNKIDVNKHINSLQADDILNQLRQQIINSLRQGEGRNDSKEGMDIALCIVDFENKQMQFAGAHNPLYLIRNNELIQYKGDKMPIGIHRNAHKSFTNNKISLQEGDMFYMLSDGFTDQFGGETGEKFLPKRFKNLLMNIHHKPMEDQHEILENEFNDWKGNRQQLDDILVMGIRFQSTGQTVIKPEKQKWENKRILIVEDTDVNYFLLVEALKRTKVKISRATNGKEAIEFCKENDADLILMDINMPVMNGNEAAKIIKSFRSDIPIIAQSAMYSEEDMQLSLQSGCDDFISKPIDMKSFISKIEKHIFKVNHVNVSKN